MNALTTSVLCWGSRAESRTPAMVRWTNAGTHIGEFAGVPATGRTFTIAGIDIYRVEGDLLAEHWHVVDQLAMLGKLGLRPAPA